MLSLEDLESLIALKKREIEKEKAQLGLTPPTSDHTVKNKENETDSSKKQVSFNETKFLGDHNAKSEGESNTAANESEEHIPADLERYIRRYIGLPVMLKAGEYSPNNPLVRGERIHGDALVGLGEYERRRNTLRKIRQAQYREYLDRQAKKKQEAKEEAEKERREYDEKERQREERERRLMLERDRYSPERRRASVTCVPVPSHNTKVDSGVQMDGVERPLSVAVQTDDAELYRVSPCPMVLTQAERELSPRTVSVEPRWDKWEERRRSYGDLDERASTVKKTNRDKLHSDLRHSFMPSIFDADAIELRNMQVEKDAAERRQFYQQELKNQIQEQQRIREERKSREKLLEQAEMRRLEEQLRMLRVAQEREIDKHHCISTAIKENSNEYDTKRTILQRDIATEQNRLRAASHPARLSRATDNEKLPSKYYQSEIYPQSEKYRQSDRYPIDNNYNTNEKNFHGSTEKSYNGSTEKHYAQSEKGFRPVGKKPYSFNIPDTSIFSSNYDVDSYLRKNLNFKNKHGEEIFNNTEINDIQDTRSDMELRTDKISDRFVADNGRNYNEVNTEAKRNSETMNERTTLQIARKDNTDTKMTEKNGNIEHRKIIIEKALVHEPKDRKLDKKDSDSLSIPVLKHSPIRPDPKENTSPLSEAMKKVDDKWKVPAVQKNILKSLPNEDGKNISILTQLGSIRRQLQLEQLKLDKMLIKDV